MYIYLKIGAGRGYWGMELLTRGVNYIGFDKHIPKKKDKWQNWCKIKRGGAKVVFFLFFILFFSCAKGVFLCVCVLIVVARVKTRNRTDGI